MKKALRSEMKALRKSIFPERRRTAEQEAVEKLPSIAGPHRYVLSYASFADEFPTGKLNSLLEKAGKLVLPRVSGNDLHLYHLPESGARFIENYFGIPEPCPEECEEVSLDLITLAFIPGLAFDREGHRLGYGKGFYDRLLAVLPAESAAYGIGFKEQLVEEPLPTHPGDHPLDGLFLF